MCFRFLIFCSQLILPTVGWSIVNPHTELALHLFQNLVNDKSSQNFAFSPYAVKSALSMIALGAKGRTAKQMGKSLDLIPPKKELNFKVLQGNRLWLQTGVPVQINYSDQVDKSYGSRPWLLDFTKAPDFVAGRVNGWMEERTFRKIKNFLPEESVEPTQKMLLTSGFAIKADWLNSFDLVKPKSNEFNNQKEVLKVGYLHRTGQFHYGKFDDVQMVQIPYKDEDFSFVILFPETKKGLSVLEKSLTPEQLEHWMGSLTPHEVSLYLPRFSFDSFVELSDALKSVGITDPFSAEADFSGITGNRELYLNKFYHKANVTVNEEGTEVGAGASLSASGLTRAPASSALSLKLDHPFLFLIRHKPTNLILTIGQVTYPTLVAD